MAQKTRLHHPGLQRKTVAHKCHRLQRPHAQTAALNSPGKQSPNKSTATLAKIAPNPVTTPFPPTTSPNPVSTISYVLAHPSAPGVELEQRVHVGRHGGHDALAGHEAQREQQGGHAVGVLLGRGGQPQRGKRGRGRGGFALKRAGSTRAVVVPAPQRSSCDPSPAQPNHGRNGFGGVGRDYSAPP